jgi:ligand-binding sensor domain-containing protein/signal transduction histidine kinase
MSQNSSWKALRRSLLLLLCLPAAPAAWGQVYQFSRYSTGQGLIQSQVMSMLQDQRGYLWMGTHRGLCRYDGVEFQEYGVKDGLSGLFVTGLCQGRGGAIWVATDNGLYRFDGRDFRLPAPEWAGSRWDVQSVYEDRAGRVWAGLRGRGVLRLQPGEPYQPVVLDSGRLSLALSFFEHPDGEFWAGTEGGLLRYDPAGSGGAYFHPLRLKGMPDSAIVYAIEQDPLGQIWIGTDAGLFLCRGNEARRMSWESGSGKLPDRTAYCIAVDPRRQLIWVGTDKGIVTLPFSDPSQARRQGEKYLYEMRSVVIDQEGIVWFGTDGGGYVRITEGIFETISTQDGLVSNLAKSFLEDDAGRIWISARDRGLDIWSEGRVLGRHTTESGLGGNAICASRRDSRGRFWFASYNGTLTCYEGGRFRVYGRAQGLFCTAAYAVAELPDGTILAGTDKGVFRLAGGRFVLYASVDRGLPDNTVYAIQPARDGRIWLGTPRGLCWFDPLRRQCSLPPAAPGTVGNNVITLLEDPEGRIWLGSSTGLACYEGDSVRIVPTGADPGSKTVVGLLMQGQDSLWVLTENGAYCLSLAGGGQGGRFPAKHFTLQDGLPSLECNANAAFLDSRGGLWLGTAEGAVRMPQGARPAERSPWPRIYITALSLEDSTLLQKLPADSLGLPRGLALPYQQNRIGFQFMGLNLRSPGLVEYRFMLEGQDAQWSIPDKKNSVYYSNLRPGAYRFMVWARREGGEWEKSEFAAFRFRIRPPFWQTWWFVLAASAALALAGWLAYRELTRRREQQREEMRIRNLAEKLRLESRALYAMMNPHFTFNALQSIQYFIHRQDKVAANKFLSSFARLIRMNLESTRSDFITLGEEIERLKLYLSLEKMRFPEKFDYEVRVKPGVDLAGAQFPPILLQPFVENSIKHGIMPLEQGGMIRIGVEKEGEEYLKITIEDNGIGIAASKRNKANRPNDHVSQGMQITMDRLQLFARMTGKHYRLDIKDLMQDNGEVAGVRVEMLLPYYTEAGPPLKA